MKSGTTTLYRHLAEHPSLFMCSPKEPQFFSRERVWVRGFDWYRSLFGAAEPGQLCGEASTCYSRSPHFGDVAGRIHEAMPSVRLIYLMRHPVERSYSHYRHSMQTRELGNEEGELVSFREALETIPEILDASDYMTQIELYLQHFPREQILLLTLDEMSHDLSATLAKIQGFLEIGPFPAPRPVVENKAGGIIPAKTTDQLLRRIRRLPVVSLAVDALPAQFRRRNRKRIAHSFLGTLIGRRRMRQHHAVISSLDDEIREELLARFAGSTRRLQSFLGRDLSPWLR